MMMMMMTCSQLQADIDSFVGTKQLKMDFKCKVMHVDNTVDSK